MTYDNEVFKTRFKRLEKVEELSLAEVATRIGWIARDSRTKREKPDSSRVARTLGLVAENGTYRTQISYTNAIALCRALHLDPREAGL